MCVGCLLWQLQPGHDELAVYVADPAGTRWGRRLMLGQLHPRMHPSHAYHPPPLAIATTESAFAPCRASLRLMGTVSILVNPLPPWTSVPEQPRLPKVGLVAILVAVAAALALCTTHCMRRCCKASFDASFDPEAYTVLKDEAEEQQSMKPWGKRTNAAWDDRQPPAKELCSEEDRADSSPPTMRREGDAEGTPTRPEPFWQGEEVSRSLPRLSGGSAQGCGLACLSPPTGTTPGAMPRTDPSDSIAACGRGGMGRPCAQSLVLADDRACNRPRTLSLR
jgi:hypothetical protein